MKLQNTRMATFFLVAFAISTLSFAIPHAGTKPHRDRPVEFMDPTLRPNKLAVRDLVAKDENPPLQKDVIPPPSPTPDPCWKRNKQSISYRSGDCMPYHWTSCTKRTHTHYIADNEIVSGHCGIVASSKIRNDADLGWEIDYDENARRVKVTLKNCGGKFCFGDKEFGAGCVVDRYTC